MAVRTQTEGLLLAKLETTYGQDAAPTPSENAILAANVDIAFSGDLIERGYMNPSLSPLPGARGKRHVEVSFETELYGSGVAGTAPRIGALFQAAQMTETVVASTSVTYAPSSDVGSAKSVTLYIYKDGRLYKVVGARGTWSLKLEAGQIGKISWQFTGKLAGAEDAAVPTATYEDIIGPVFVNATVNIDGTSFALVGLSLDMGNSLTVRDDAGASDGIADVVIPKREPSCEIEMWAVLGSEKDFLSLWQNASEIDISAVWGSAGNKVTVAAHGQIKEYKYGNKDDILTYSFPVKLVGQSGDDELSIKLE